MINTMDDYMLEAQKLSLANIEKRKEITKKFVDTFKKKKYHRVILVASGSSYNIASNVRYFMQKYLRMEIRLVWSATFVNYETETVNDDDLVIFLSQGGHSTNTVAAAKIMKENKKDAIAMTNWVDSPLKDYVKTIIGYNSTPGDKFVTKGLVMSTLFIMLASIETALELQLVDQATYDHVIAQITKSVHKLPEVREAAIQFYEENKEFVQEFERVMLIGCGPTFGTALEGALKLTETYGCPATAYDVEEILHGPAYEIYQNHTIVVVDTEDSKVHERMLDVYKGMQILTKRVMLLTTDEQVTGRYILRLKKDNIEEEIAVLYLVVPFQYLSHIVCQDTRVTSIDRRNAKFMKLMATKLPGNRF
ncbi:MAG: glucoselysine-6-phosphate deglycase [Chloroflexota bacterium]|nr:glucoselysine-6-phosphate deglycase [Chloroflexota bacterium]